jgi:hypothetical protein
MNTDNGTLQLLLQEFRGLRDELREFRDTVTSWHNDHTARLSSLETQMKTGVTGNGTPSRLAVAEDRIDGLVQYKYWLIGVAAGVSAIASLIVAFLVERFK